MVEVRAILLSPYCAELAGLKLQRLRFVSAFSACCRSLFLAEPGEPMFLECPRILADSLGGLMVRDTAHVANTLILG